MDYIGFENIKIYPNVINVKYIYFDGRVMHEMKHTNSNSFHKDQLVEIARMELNTVTRLFNLFTDDILKRQNSDPSSMTYSIIFNKDNKTYKWSFDRSNPPPFLREIYWELEQVFNTFY